MNSTTIFGTPPPQSEPLDLLSPIHNTSIETMEIKNNRCSGVDFSQSWS